MDERRMKMKRNISFYFLALIILILIIPYTYTAHTSTVFAQKKEARIVSAEILHLREGPGLSYTIIDTLQKNELLKVLDSQGEWLYVEVSGEKGWVASWLTQETNKDKSNKYAISQVDHLNIRLEPSLNSPVLAQLNTGDQVLILDEKEKWVQIQFQQLTGWISTDYITISEAQTEKEEVKETEKKANIDKEPDMFTIAVDAVVVRSKPNLTSKELGVAKKGEQYKILARDHHWMNIEFNGKEGWLYSYYGTFETVIKEKDKTNSVTIIYNGTNLRKEPSTSSEVLMNAEPGEQFEILGVEDDWYKIQLPDGSVGYVANWVVTTNEKTTAVEKKKQNRKKGTLNGVTIILDPGHGGNDQGTAGLRGTLEKEITLKTAELLKTKLQAAGAEVILTRESDVYVGLQKRVSFAHQNEADAFISIHYDAIEDNRTISGFTTYYYHSYQESLAQYVHKGIANQINLRDRGVNFGDYLVLRENNQKAVLVELGYLSNPSEEKIITTEKFREQATMGIYEGILKYFDAELEEK